MIEIRVDENDQPATTDGGHHHEQTRVIAEGIAEAFRLLNYATMAEKHGLDYPSDVYSVLGALSGALHRLPQALEQMTAFVERQVSAGAVRENRGYGFHGGDADLACADLAERTQAASGLAVQLAEALGEARAAISGLEVVDGARPEAS